MMKKNWLIALMVITLLFTLTACGGATDGEAGEPADDATTGENEIWYSTKNSTELVHVAMADGVTNAADLLGFEGEVTVAEADAAKQNNQMNNLVENIGPEAIVLNPYDSDSVADVINKAKEAGIPIAVIDNKANGADADVSILFDSIESGKKAAEKTVELLTAKHGEPRGVVVNLYGEVVSQVFKERAQGFEDYLADYENIEVISVLGAPQADVATSALNNIIADTNAQGKTIDLVNTPTDTATLGVIESLKINDMWFKKGEEGHVMIVSHDGLGDILAYVEEGYVDAEVVIDVFGVGGIAVEVLEAYTMQGEPVPTSGTFTPQGEYLNEEVTFSEGDNGPTIMLSPIVVDETGANNPLIWGNAGQ